MIGCPICEQGQPGWVCEDHPGQPFQHDECGGAGAPCECNPAAVVVWQKVYAEREEMRH